MLSKVEGAEWLIVFDSLKAREQKNRGALIERIKSDFAKFTNRFMQFFLIFSCSFLFKFLYRDFFNVPCFLSLTFIIEYAMRCEFISY